MSLSAVASEHRRIAILRHLADCAEYVGNASILQDVANGLGIPTTRDQVIGELAWLKDQALVTVEDKTDFVIATLTQKGLDVASGRLTYPGVKRPRPQG